MRKYTPRRAGKRWLDGAPEYVLDVFDDNGDYTDRYTVLFGGSLLVSDGTFANTYVQGLGMSDAPAHPQGVSMWIELGAYQAASYRYSNGHHRIKWCELPEHIQRHIVARAEETHGEEVASV